ncbi:MAG: DMT family transporter [Verrucomicrobia bacterium]|nr:DMT family transporter [Verrucomicrobiota bacterium]
MLLAVHFISWIAGARMTPGANASLLVNMTPAVMPFVLYLLAGLICLAIAGIHGAMAGAQVWIGPRVGHELLMIAGLAVVPTLLGHSIVNWSFKVFRGQVVSLLVLGQLIFAGITTYLILDETPSPAFFGAVFFVVAGMVLVVLQGRRN